MAIRHTPEQKMLALETLRDTGGDITQTAAKTGIPERTLYHWRRALWQNWRQQVPSPKSPKPLPQFEDDLDALDFLRQQIMAELLNLANNFQSEMAFTTPVQRVMIMNQLSERYFQLEKYLAAHTEEEIQYVYEYEVEHKVEKIYKSTSEDDHRSENIWPIASNGSMLWNVNNDQLDTPDDTENTQSLN